MASHVLSRDTVSSVGITRGPTLPETTTGMRHVCVFRHALALGQRRRRCEGGLVCWNALRHVRCLIRESCFILIGCSGGGNAPNMLELEKFGPPLRWMVYEAKLHGLLVDSLDGTWVPSVYNNSMTGIWKILEILPILRLSYKGKQTTERWCVV